MTNIRTTPYRLDDESRFKIAVVGDMNVGKTCLAMRFVNNNFRETHRPTVSDIETKHIQIDGEEVVYQIWDTAGQERFRSLLPMYMKGADGAIIVYDVTSKASFENLPMWYTEVQKNVSCDTVVMIVGNKLDIMADFGCVSTAEGVSIARKLGCMHFEASAKTGENVNELFIKLGEEIIRKRQRSNSNGYTNSLSFSLRQKLTRTSKKPPLQENKQCC